MLRYETLVLTTGLAIGSAMAQTPPTTTGSPEGAIMHPRESPSISPTDSHSSQLQLTTAQKAAIVNAVRSASPKSVSLTNFVAAVGAPVPPTIQLDVLPDAALAVVPEAKIIRYATIQNQVVLVDPTTMRVVDILRK